MAENTSIAFVHHSFSPWRGCREVDSGCNHCYARDISKRNPKVLGGWAVHGPRVLASDDQWRKMRKLDRRAERAGEQHRVIFNWGDPFEDWIGVIKDQFGRTVLWCEQCDELKRSDEVCRCNKAYRRIATMQDVRRAFFKLVDETPNLLWLLSTKRPEEIYHLWPGDYRPNVFLGISVTDTADATKKNEALARVDHLAGGTWVACEPLIGACNLVSASLVPHFVCECGQIYISPGQCPVCRRTDAEIVYCGVDWVVIGGETGRSARPCRLEWIESIIRQCRESSLPVFVSHVGRRPCDSNDQVIPLVDAKGGDPTEWPEELRVREYPDFDSLTEEL